MDKSFNIYNCYYYKEYIILLYYFFSVGYIIISIILFNPLASPSTGAPALKYGDVNTVTPYPGEVKGLIRIV